MNIRRYALVALVLLIVDWVLAALHVAGILPSWSFLVLNFPFGLPSVWFESHWAGTHYSIGGQTIKETWSLVAFFFTVFAQAWVYSWLLGHWQQRHHAISTE